MNECLEMKDERSETVTLESRGWTRQFIANEPRLTEAVELYEDSGFEVHLEPLQKEPGCDSRAGPEDAQECRVCFEGIEDQYRVIYTRPKKNQPAESNDDLF